MWINGGAAHTGAEQGLGVGSSYFRRLRMAECQKCTDAKEYFENGEFKWEDVIEYAVHISTAPEHQASSISAEYEDRGY